MQRLFGMESFTQTPPQPPTPFFPQPHHSSKLLLAEQMSINLQNDNKRKLRTHAKASTFQKQAT